MCRFILLLLYSTSALYCLAVSTGLQCESSDNGLKFSINNQRNRTGHWVTEVKLVHAAELKETGPWEMDIDHNTGICEGSKSVIITARITAPPQRPPADYEFIPGLGYYKFHVDFKDFNEAIKACQTEGSHLAIINSENEAKALEHFWIPYPTLFSDWRNICAYVGFHDQFVEGEYITIFNEPLNSTGYMKWSPREPTLGPPEDCGIIFRETGLLRDVTCTYKLAFFCEWEL